MSVFKPQGRAHKILTALTEGPHTFSQINDLFPEATAQSRERDKLWHVVGALVSDGLIESVDAAYVATPDAAGALVALDAGREFDPETPTHTSVRIFARSAA